MKKLVSNSSNNLLFSNLMTVSIYTNENDNENIQYPMTGS